MRASGITADDKRTWGAAAATALVAHVALAALILAWARPAVPPVPEPVVLVELPPEAASAPAVAPQQADTPPQPDFVQPQAATPPIDLPPVRAPLPSDPVTLPPPPAPAPMRTALPAAPVAVARPAVAAPAATGATSPAPGADPRAKRAEADYFSLISAHLNRRKTYPAEAKKARQQGVVTVRFTVDRNGNVSGVSIRRGSGFDILDSATLALLQRVAPLPRMPAAMQRDSVTIALPIDYSLKTD